MELREVVRGEGHERNRIPIPGEGLTGAVDHVSYVVHVFHVERQPSETEHHGPTR